ncbi:MAG: hypothetical protein IH627_05475 [Rubrivivax sp.]|nr:hypothetical protein [Rubrivivax sp.]
MSVEITIRRQSPGMMLALLETRHDRADALRLYERCGHSRRAAFGAYPDNGLPALYDKRL